MTEIVDNCQIEWDKTRGVLYVHNQNTGQTIIRICRLDKSQKGSISKSLLDITEPERVQYPHEHD